MLTDEEKAFSSTAVKRRESAGFSGSAPAWC
jgi:hypothetical protein